MRRIFIYGFLLIILFSVFTSCKKEEKHSDFVLTLSVRGAYVYSYGVVVGANYYVRLTIKEIAGVGADVLSVTFTIFDIYGYSKTYVKSGTEVFGTSHIYPNGTLSAENTLYLGAALLAEGTRFIVKIEFMDEEGKKITKEVETSIEW